MAYSQVGIINLALGRIGVKKISSMTEDSMQAIAAKVVWDYLLDEVLQAKDWKFAKTRAVLAKSVTIPEYGWDFAYPLPGDFLRLAQATADDPALDPPKDVLPYVIEALPDGTLSLLTDYDNSREPLKIAYIRRVTNPLKFTAHFINALAFRLAAELSIPVTESLEKFQAMIRLYERALTEAEETNRSLDSIEDEMGLDSWETAGR